MVKVLLLLLGVLVARLIRGRGLGSMIVWQLLLSILVILRVRIILTLNLRIMILIQKFVIVLIRRGLSRTRIRCRL